MGLIEILINAALQVWYIFPVILLTYITTTPWFKGLWGEFQVNMLLKRLPKNEYHRLKNITLPTDNGTTQIDHIVVSQFGVFIVETKNMKGWIFGSANEKQWTQKIYHYSSKFQNPIHQNYKHLKTLEALLNINIDALFSVVVFIGKSEFKTDMPDNVTHASGCLSYIRSHSVELLDPQQVLDIINNIESGCLARGFATNQAHKVHVKEIIKQKTDQKLCTKCGSYMVLREAKKGQNAGSTFWGCSSFPKCRAVEKFN
ncbi:nuclease-related domain-containing protein [Shewanella litoralis]|uniref:DNA-binding protein n=1 Tax=Shewanella litoralis TaxID=2282700 RepID=A0ABQ2QZ37_9GAMM|nr:NERD domain-containing protein [Shewanella litoralis]GGQ04897.1 DNA-binding protein [Shewanella litoralis]